MFFEKNEIGRDFVVGDIHGCYNELCNHLSRINFDRDVDRLFAVGDLIDRGPDSEKVVRLFSSPPFFSCLGNHEDMMIACLRENGSLSMWLNNGGDWSVETDRGTLEELCDIIFSFPLYMTIDTDSGLVGVCHTDPPADWGEFDNGKQSVRDCALWGRSVVNGKSHQYINGVSKSIHGHTPLKTPMRVGNMIFIDTGACFGGDLTIVQIQEET